MKKRTIVCFGAGPAFKGGMSNYNTSLATAFSKQKDVEVFIVSWIQQYPNIVPREFKDLVSKVDFLEGTSITCKYITNYNNPITWYDTARYIANLKPEIVIVQWSIAIQGLPLSFMIKKLKSLSTCEVILDLHFVKQKEQGVLDHFLAKMGISSADSYITHALNTYQELKTLFPNKKFLLSPDGTRSQEDNRKTVIKLFHPIYDLYKSDPSFNILEFKNKYRLKKHVFLFFGFIRKYKGLDLAIEAFSILAKERNDVSLLICGESFWNTLNSENIITKIKKSLFNFLKLILLKSNDDEHDYQPLSMIDQLNIKHDVVVFNTFIPNEDVHKYFQVSDCVLLFYRTATPSGIESLSYNFDLPILATAVGHFPETIEDGKNGYLADSSVESMVNTMRKFLKNPIPNENVKNFKENLSWNNYVKAILNKQPT